MPEKAPTKTEVLKAAANLRLGGDARRVIKLIDEYLSRVNRNDIDVLLLKGPILEMITKSAEATRVYSRVLRIDPTNTQALIDLGDAYASWDKKEYAKAIRYYNRALRLAESGQWYRDKEDEVIEACVGKADALLELNRPMDALRCIVNGLQKYPADLLLCDTLQRARERYELLQKRKWSKRQRERYEAFQKSLQKMRREERKRKKPRRLGAARPSDVR